MDKEEYATVNLCALMMAAEKMGNLLFTIAQTLEFMDEYEILCDDVARKELKPWIAKLNKWTEAKLPSH